MKNKLKISLFTSLLFSSLSTLSYGYPFTCPPSNSIEITPQNTNQYIWKGPFIRGYSNWESVPQNASAARTQAEMMELIYLKNPGFFHILCYYNTNQSSPKLPADKGMVVYAYGWSGISKDACKQTGLLTVNCGE